MTNPNQPTTRFGGIGSRPLSIMEMILAGLFIFGVLGLLTLAASGQLTRMIGRPVANVADRGPVIGTDDGALLGAGDKTDPAGPSSGVAPVVAGRFQSFYTSRDGLRLLGLPLSQPLVEGGREVQWFERGRLEYFPEYLGTPYEVQLGLVGLQYTEGRNFPPQQFFASRPDLRFFPETGHGVGGLFLQYWQQNGGLDAFGLPISEEFDEQLADGRLHRVQYFQRARMEYWPEYAGTTNQIQLGLLGKALYAKDPRPVGVPDAPTNVPLP